jgi:DNA-directed RNA polymerase subunit beta
MVSVASTLPRRSFGSIPEIAPIPNLIEVQKDSYKRFLECNPDNEGNMSGLETVFKSLFPIRDYDGKSTLEYVRYEFGEPKYDVEEALSRGVNFSAPLRVIVRLIVWDVDEEAGIREVKSIKEQEVYMGDVPLMTENGTFIINGAERVIVSQMHRSPGVFYFHDGGKSHSSGKFLYSARVIPARGSWLDLEFDVKDLLYFRIDRRRKLYITTLLRALGYDKEQIFDEFYSRVEYKISGNKWITKFQPEKLKGAKIYQDIIDADSGEILVAANTKVTPRMIKKFKEQGEHNCIVSPESLVGSFMAQDVVDNETGEIIAESGDEVTLDIITQIQDLKLDSIRLLDIDYKQVGPYIRNSLILDKNLTQEEALADIYRVMRPGEPSTPEAAEKLFHQTFFDNDRYDLSRIGRMKINAKHQMDVPEDHTVLTKEDMIAVIKHIIDLRDGRGEVDDIDNLGNRRVRSVGELVENQFRLGLVRMERSIIERMSAVEIDTVMPHDLINSKALMSVVREFFGTSQLSQFMDQTNPLAEITHKRRVSALGPGGLTRERAGFEVRDVHTTHYGRICPIETPEGPNIGLINSLACYAKINKYGFIESPYRKVESGRLTNEVQYLSALDEARYTIAQANSEVDDQGNLVGDIRCRRDGEVIVVSPDEVDYIDVSPKQMVSVAASLIPFIENDDANRALMGANMQRQAVPLLKAEAPMIGTGMEKVVAHDSGSGIVAKRDGTIVQVDGKRIVVQVKDEKGDTPGVDIYKLIKFKKSNQSTSITQKPIVMVGDQVKKGEMIADGPSTRLGELALGKNVLVAFMPWNGYNFEDSILVSERISQQDVYTSVHIEEFEVIARDTRLGPEEITRDIPNVGEEALRKLDEIGIVHIGAEVKTGDILVGKVTPKTESPITPEEKLLRAIFGEKAADVKDTSLRVPPGVKGTIVDIKVFTRRGIEKDERAIALERSEIDTLSRDRDDELKIINQHTKARVYDLLVGKEIVSAPKGVEASGKLEAEYLEGLGMRSIWQFSVDDEKAMAKFETLKETYENAVKNIEHCFRQKVEKVQSGDDLPQGALKVVKVYIASKSKLQPGDKMAGRHGNKGVVSKICPIEDMPFLEDGRAVDIVLNPLGVPSRMNIGQVLEVHLGWASANIGNQVQEAIEQYRQSAKVDELRKRISSLYDGKNDKDIVDKITKASDEEITRFVDNLKDGLPFATPVFDGASEEEISVALEKAGVSRTGQVRLIDGRTGDYFDRPVTVGYMYMLKLDHLVEDKIHARSIGPYSLVTQQPLGGKSHFGGQRFGEMECWALQAYGAAYTLQEMLTVKSDDVYGRVRTYESIIGGDDTFEYGVPESFNVMVKELRSLCLNIAMLDANEDE